MAVEMEDQLQLKVVNSESLSDVDRNTIISLCNWAYEEDLESLFNIFRTAVHVLGYYAQFLVSHAMWVNRRLQIGTNPVMPTAYIEMVATEKTYSSRGLAAAIMKRVADEIQDFDLSALSIQCCLLCATWVGNSGVAHFFLEPTQDLYGRRGMET